MCASPCRQHTHHIHAHSHLFLLFSLLQSDPDLPPDHGSPSPNDEVFDHAPPPPPYVPPQPSIEEARQQMHSLLDDAFALVSPSSQGSVSVGVTQVSPALPSPSPSPQTRPSRQWGSYPAAPTHSPFSAVRVWVCVFACTPRVSSMKYESYCLSQPLTFPLSPYYYFASKCFSSRYLTFSLSLSLCSLPSSCLEVCRVGDVSLVSTRPVAEVRQTLLY